MLSLNHSRMRIQARLLGMYMLATPYSFQWVQVLSRLWYR